MKLFVPFRFDLFQIVCRFGRNRRTVCQRAEDTFCCECGERLVKRDWYDVTVVGKEVFDGKCLKCGAKQDGVWETEVWIVCLKRVRNLRNDRMNE